MCGSGNDKTKQEEEFNKKLESFESSLDTTIDSVSQLGNFIFNHGSELASKASSHLMKDLKYWLVDNDLPEDHIATQTVDMVVDDLFKGKFEPFTDFRNPVFGQSDVAFETIFDSVPWRRRRHAKQGKTPFGLYAYPTPTPTLYNACAKMEGESVWDEYGYWRCLFPKASVPEKFLVLNDDSNPRIVTKEDFQEAGGVSAMDSNGVIDFGVKGKFFKQFDSYMNWKSVMVENVARDKVQKMEDRKKFWHDKKQRWKEASSRVQEATDEPLINVEKKVISTSKVTTYNSTENGYTKTEKIQKWYDDGSSILKEIERTKPANSKNWNVIENVKEMSANSDNWNAIENVKEVSGDSKSFYPSAAVPRTIEQPYNSTNDKKGWFWDGSDK